jgi:hypothetical protein
VCAPVDPQVQKTFEQEPDFVPIANKSRAPARAMTEPILKKNLPRIKQDLAPILIGLGLFQTIVTVTSTVFNNTNSSIYLVTALRASSHPSHL